MDFYKQAQISERHKLAQAKVQTLVTKDVAKSFALLDYYDLEKTFPIYLQSMNLTIAKYKKLSSTLAAAYYLQIRNEYQFGDNFIPNLASEINSDQIRANMAITGPVVILKSMASGNIYEEAKKYAIAATAKSAQRLSLDGGRATIIGSSRRDRFSQGWARLTDGKPCSFCAMLASRGPVYKEDTSKFRSHDGCGCSAVPVFDLSAPWPGRAEEFRALYDETISGRYAGGKGNNDAVKAWRSIFDATYNN